MNDWLMPTGLLLSPTITQTTPPMANMTNQELDDLARRYRELMASQQTLLLSTASANGVPDISYAPFVRDDAGNFYIYVSEMASHTANLQTNP